MIDRNLNDLWRLERGSKSCTALQQECDYASESARPLPERELKRFTEVAGEDAELFAVFGHGASSDGESAV